MLINATLSLVNILELLKQNQNKKLNLIVYRKFNIKEKVESEGMELEVGD